MRGYKQEQSALGISRLIAFAGNHLARWPAFGRFDGISRGAITRLMPLSLFVYPLLTKFGTVTLLKGYSYEACS
jgi:hypothetical protein